LEQKMKKRAGLCVIVVCIAGLVGTLNCMPLHPHGNEIAPHAAPYPSGGVSTAVMKARTLAGLKRQEQADRAVLADPRATADQKRKASVDYRYEEINRHGVVAPNEGMPLRDLFQNTDQ
jgi:hypothetical protein